MAHVAAITSGNLRARVADMEDCRAHFVVPQLLIHMQTALAALQHFLQYALIMGATPRPLMTEWLKLLAQRLKEISQLERDRHATQRMQLVTEAAIFHTYARKCAILMAGRVQIPNKRTSCKWPRMAGIFQR